MRNRGLKFICRHVHIRVERTAPFSLAYKPGEVLRIPIAHNEGSYFASEEDIARLEDNDQVLFRYCSPQGEVSDRWNPNGSLHNIAGVMNEQYNVMGMMPHPERASEACLGSEDGRRLFVSLLRSVAERVGTR